MFDLTMHSTYFIYGYLVLDIQVMTTWIMKKETQLLSWNGKYLSGSVAPWTYFSTELNPAIIKVGMNEWMNV